MMYVRAQKEWTPWYDGQRTWKQWTARLRETSLKPRLVQLGPFSFITVLGQTTEHETAGADIVHRVNIQSVWSIPVSLYTTLAKNKWKDAYWNMWKKKRKNLWATLLPNVTRARLACTSHEPSFFFRDKVSLPAATRVGREKRDPRSFLRSAQYMDVFNPSPVQVWEFITTVVCIWRSLLPTKASFEVIYCSVSWRWAKPN